MLIPPDLGPAFMRLIEPIWKSDYPDHIKLNALWEMLTKAQGTVLSQVLSSRLGDKVFAGPFRGMQLSKDLMKWHFAPMLLGTYEWEIHDAIESIIASAAKKILTIGTITGYYSVGLALRMPEATIYAFDTDPERREQCRQMATLNGVADRVLIGDAFQGEDFARFSGEDNAVLMHLKGEEAELLDPQKYAALSKMNVIVRLYNSRSLQQVPTRFAQSHAVRIIPNTPFSFPLEKVLGADYTPDHFDNLIATWEQHNGAAPFGLFKKK